MAFGRLGGPRWVAVAMAISLAAAALVSCGEDEPAPVAMSDGQGSGAAAPETDAGAAATATAEARRELAGDIITVLPKDRIPSIDFPFFIAAAEAGGIMADDELVIGVSIDGDHRAYSVPHLSRHEIVNDVVGGRPIAVTW